MAAAALPSPASSAHPPPPAFSAHSSSFSRNLPAVGINVKCPAKWRHRRILRRSCIVDCSSSTPGSTGSFQRRDFLLSCLSSSTLLIFTDSGICAKTEQDEDVKTAVFVDEINAYSFLYPVELPAKKSVFKWVESRKPERYSSAAPLSPDARQRIVSERVDMINNVVVSVSIGPPNSSFLTSPDKSTWNAKDVADSILSDKSTMRIATGQRMAESSVLDVHSSEVDGESYWHYEYLIRKSPTNSLRFKDQTFSGTMWPQLQNEMGICTL